MRFLALEGVRLKSNDKFEIFFAYKKGSCICNKHVYLVDGSQYYAKTTINPVCMC